MIKEVHGLGVYEDLFSGPLNLIDLGVDSPIFASVEAIILLRPIGSGEEIWANVSVV